MGLRLESRRLTAWSASPAAGPWNAFDAQLALYALALAVVGLMMAYTNSADAPLAVGSVFTRGLMWLALAIVVFAVVCTLDYRWFRAFRWPVYLANLGLLAITLLIGTGVGGVARWVTIFGLQFQFSELAKILMALVLAAFIANRQDRLGSLGTSIGMLLLMGPPLALVLIQPDLGTSLVFGAMLVGMLFLTGGSLRWLAVGIGTIVALLPVIWVSVLKDYQKQRLVSFLDPTVDPQGSGYQLIQSQIAVGSGGLFGRGLTNGTQTQLDYLPVQSTDFVYATLAEELGFVGGMVVLILFAALIWRILVIGWRSQDLFGLAFAAGIASMLLFQLLVNVGMVLGIMPITGIPLPLVTHGGASLTSLAVGLGLLQSVCMRRRMPAP